MVGSLDMMSPDIPSEYERYKKRLDSDLSYEDLFEHATEDISTYLWAIQEWLDPEDGYAQDYLLMLILSNRKRSRLAAERMARDVPLEYQHYKTKLLSLKDRTEDLLKEELLLHNKRIEKIISDEFFQRVKAIESDLQKLRHITHDGILFDNTEWVEDDLREYAKRFLMNFHDMALANGELEEKPFQTVINAEGFREKFVGTEQLFRKYFGYFHVIQDLFPTLRDREYDPDLWWLNHIPGPDDVEEDEISEAFMDELSRAFQAEKRSATEDCPRADNVIAYAFNELDPELNRETREHLLTCGGCFDLFMDLRVAEAHYPVNEVPEVMPGLADAIMKQSDSEEHENDVLQADIIRIIFIQRVIAFAVVMRHLVVRYTDLYAGDDDDEEETAILPGIINVTGYREGNIVNLTHEEIPEEIEKLIRQESEEVPEKVIPFLEESGDRHFYQILRESDGKWLPCLDKHGKTRTAEIKVTDATPDRFLLLLDQGIKGLRQSTEAMTALLNNMETEGQSLSPFTIILTVKVSEGDKQ